MNEILRFFIDNFPSWKMIFYGGPIGLGYAFIALYTAGWLKRNKGWKTGYSRKLFHFTIFFSVAMIQFVWGTPAMCLFGGMTTAVIFIAVLLGDGNILYEAMAREKDAPHRTWFIITPYFATFAGGVLANVLFGNMAVAGYLVAGLGDAVGEPIGTRFGKHVYSVPSYGGVRSQRSMEGSIAVCVASIISLFAACFLIGMLDANIANVLLLVAVGIACALIEAVSPHGWDNMTMQLVPSGMIYWIAKGVAQ